MKNAKLGKVEMRSSRLPSARHNLSRDVHTTMSFCDFQPTMVHEMEPDSSFTMNIETGVLMAPMVVPTMGRLNMESFGIFVPTEDVFPCYKEFKTGTFFNYAGTTYVPKYRPQMIKALLSCFCLFGARCTLYDCVNPDTPLESEQRWKCLNAVGTNALIESIKASYGGAKFLDTGSIPALGNETFHCINFRYILGSTGLDISAPIFHTGFFVPVAGNPLATNNGFIYGKENTVEAALQNGNAPVSILKPDFQVNIPYKSDSTSTTFDKLACLCFKMSDYGRRLYRVLRAIGIKPSFNDPSMMDATPIFAVWKAYYDMFGVKKWDNYQSTSMCRLINGWLSNNAPEFMLSTSTMANYFFNFMVDLGRMWYTDEQDFITSHQANIEDDPTSPITANGFFDVGNALGQIGNAGDVVQYFINSSPSGAPTDAGMINAHHAIVRTLHSQVDSELLKKFYLWSNRDSVIGMDVAELLRAQGHGKWVDEHQSRFVGHHTIPLKIDKVVSQSDTYDEVTEQGTMLGEYGGRGIGYDGNSVMSYKANEHGFFIVLSVVVPKAGFCQGEDLRWKRVTRMDDYQPEFDGVGMEASPKSLVFAGSNRSPLNSVTDKPRYHYYNQTFGFVPHYAHYKYLQNLMNGEFDFGSTSLDKMCYTLDRLLFGNDVAVELVEESDEYDEYKLHVQSLNASTMPIAGPLWRYLGRYGFLANFRRIFAVRGSSDDVNRQGYFVQGAYGLELTVSGPDDFIVHQVQNNLYWARMLPLSASYETKQDGNAGSADMMSSKA